ncbi:hypothetical protein D3C76_1108730 [compost metagenome]
MLVSYYKETPLEQWITTKYLDHGIIDPHHNDIERIADSFGVDLLYERCPSFSDNEDRVIFLNKDADELTARIIFFHELCHVLRHAGDQRFMSQQFKRAQEQEAEQFVLYAAIPFFMFAKLPVPDHRHEAISYLSDIFRVPLDLAEQRLDQIQRRMLHGSLVAAAREADRQKRNQETGWSSETKRILDQLDRQLGKKERHVTCD